jgi:uncharacterized coiled-coil protein SlyX
VINQEQASTIAALKKALAQQQVQIEALASGLQKVNNKREITKAASEAVAAR